MSRVPASASPLRCLSVWLLTTAAVLGAARCMVPRVAAGTATADGAVVLVCEAALLGCAGWVWLVVTVVALDVRLGRSTARRGIPLAARRAVLVACGVALAGSAPALPSYAAGTTAAGDQDPPAAVVRGLPLPDRAGAARPPERLVVRAGDTLWDLAAKQLTLTSSVPPSDAAVVRAWHRLYEANRAVVGPDPDLLLPGQRLALPDLGEESR